MSQAWEKDAGGRGARPRATQLNSSEFCLDLSSADPLRIGKVGPADPPGGGGTNQIHRKM